MSPEDLARIAAGRDAAWHRRHRRPAPRRPFAGVRAAAVILVGELALLLLVAWGVRWYCGS